MWGEKLRSPTRTLKILGLELELMAESAVKVHQSTFATEFLTKHGCVGANGIDHVPMEAVAEEQPPTPNELHSLQPYG